MDLYTVCTVQPTLKGWSTFEVNARLFNVRLPRHWLIIWHSVDVLYSYRTADCVDYVWDFLSLNIHMMIVLYDMWLSSINSGCPDMEEKFKPNQSIISYWQCKLPYLAIPRSLDSNCTGYVWYVFLHDLTGDLMGQTWSLQFLAPGNRAVWYLVSSFLGRSFLYWTSIHLFGSEMEGLKRMN